MDNLNPQQREAVDHNEGPLLVVAGAGTGKTQVITKRIARLIESGEANPSEILALTFTEKAAAEMEQRMVDLLGYLHGVDLMTFNGFGDGLVKRFSRDIGLSSDLELLSDVQRNIVVSDNIDRFKLDYFAPISRPEKYISDMLGLFSKLKNELVLPEDYLSKAKGLAGLAETEADKLEAKKHLELANAYNEYIRLFRENNYLDYDDQIILAIEILESRANVLDRKSVV